MCKADQFTCETLTTWARLIWRGVALSNNTRDVTANVDMYNKWNGMTTTLTTFVFQSFGDSRGFSTTVSPWFKPSTFYDIMPVFGLRLTSNTGTVTYRIGQMWI